MVMQLGMGHLQFDRLHVSGFSKEVAGKFSDITKMKIPAKIQGIICVGE